MSQIINDILSANWLPVAQACGFNHIASRPVSGEYRCLCPTCDQTRKNIKNKPASIHIGGAKDGQWRCFKCKTSGHIREEAINQGLVTRVQLLPNMNKPDDSDTSMETVWQELRLMRHNARKRIINYFVGRNWPVGLATLAFAWVDVAWAFSKEDRQFIRHKPTWKVSSHALKAKGGARPLLFAIRNDMGQVELTMRRAVGPVEGGKGKIQDRELLPGTADEGVMLFGNLDKWSQAVLNGKVGLIVEGEIDYAAAVAMTKYGKQRGQGRCPWDVVLGAPSAGALGKAAKVIAESIAGQEGGLRRVMLIPDLGDKDDIGLRKMRQVASAIRASSRKNITSTALLGDIKVSLDLCDVLERHGVQEVFDRVRPFVPRVAHTSQTRRVVFGDVLREIVFEDHLDHNGNPVHKTSQKLADAVWPAARTEDMESGQTGLRYIYLDAKSRLREGFLLGGDWVDKSPAKRAATEAGNQGVRIVPGKGVHWVMAMARAYEARDLTDEITTATPGWHIKSDGDWIETEADAHISYVSGIDVIGHASDHKWRYIGPDLRSDRKGTVEGWTQWVSSDACTPAMRLAVGCALAGALVKLLRLRNCPMLHLAGASRSGKTTAAQIAMTIWTDYTRRISWDASAVGLVSEVMGYRDACVVIDELQQWSRDAKDLGVAIHSLTNGIERGRSRPDGTARKRRAWTCSFISTGEVTIESKLGAHLQGGHIARIIDLRLRPGEATLDRAHAEDIQRIAPEFCGVAGDAWVKWLIEQDPRKMVAHLRRFDADLAAMVPGLSSEQRDRLATIGVMCFALHAAHKAGLLEFPNDEIGVSGGMEKKHHLGMWAEERGSRRAALNLAVWCIERLCEDQGKGVDPSTRMHLVVWDAVDTRPAHFPYPMDENVRGPIVGYLDKQSDGHAMWTTKRMLSSAVKAGVLGDGASDSKAYIEWATKQGLIIHPNKAERIAGKKRMWLKLLRSSKSHQMFDGSGDDNDDKDDDGDTWL